jgi:hypothetical protein
MFKPGDKVVKVDRAHSTCPNVDHHARAHVVPTITTGRVYTVKSVIHTDARDGLALLLKEADPGHNYGYCLGVFRKVEPAEPSFIERYLRPKVPA